MGGSFRGVRYFKVDPYYTILVLLYCLILDAYQIHTKLLVCSLFVPNFKAIRLSIKNLQ